MFRRSGYLQLAFALCIGLIYNIPPSWGAETLTQLIEAGNTLAENGQYEEAVRAYKRALQLYNSADALYNLAVIYDHELNYKAKAVYYYQKYLALAPGAKDVAQVKMWLRLAKQELEAELKPHKSGQKRHSLALSMINPEPEDEYCRQGNQYLAQGKYEQAILAYKRGVVLNQSPEACYNLALIYDYDLGYKIKAIYYYQRFLGLVSPSSKQLLEVRARLQALKHNLAKQKNKIYVEASQYKLHTGKNAN